MRPSEDIRPITYMKIHSSNLIKEVSEKKNPIVITQNGEAKAVLIDIKSYEKQRDTLLMLKLVLYGEKEIRNGKLIPQDKVFSNIDKRLADA